MTDFRKTAYDLLNQLIAVPDDQLSAFMAANFSPDVVWDVSHPVNRLEGVDAVRVGLVEPLRNALSHIRRRDEIFIGGRNRVGEGQWVASVTHYVGNFQAPLLGIDANDRLVFLRSGEFYRVEDGRIVEAKLIIDLLDLMRQAGRFPLPDMLGNEMLFPGPATHDGVLPEPRDDGERSMDLVDAMLTDLREYDEETFESKNQTGAGGYWHEDMLWYGPGGIGSNYRWEGFLKDHRVAFLRAFPDRMGGNSYCRMGDGNYAAISGWPSMTMTHEREYLGVAATNKKLTLRVMDFYRCADNKIMENWVLLDYLDLFQQMGIDMIANAQRLEPAA